MCGIVDLHIHGASFQPQAGLFVPPSHIEPRPIWVCHACVSRLQVPATSATTSAGVRVVGWLGCAQGSPAFSGSGAGLVSADRPLRGHTRASLFFKPRQTGSGGWVGLQCGLPIATGWICTVARRCPTERTIDIYSCSAAGFLPRSAINTA